jgi:hypothetical protein
MHSRRESNAAMIGLVAETTAVPQFAAEKPQDWTLGLNGRA